MIDGILSPNAAGIPASLKAIPQWLCWAAVREGDKIRKPPIRAAGQNQGMLASPVNPDHWATFDRAFKFYEMHAGEPVQGGRLAGIGLALTREAGIIGIDLDGVVVDGVLSAWGAGVAARIGAYAELSPSGKGLHVFLRGALPWPGKRTKQIEIYGHDRYLTVTGRWMQIEGAFDAAA